ncbi:MAG: hypothetical protein NUW23_00720 [Firmicutes bacterium]|nr:hypothetical protein [Bacillota bacterium]
MCQGKRDIVVELLAECGLLVTVPHGAFYILADISRTGLDSYTFATRLLSEARVAVASGETFGNVAAEGRHKAAFATGPSALPGLSSIESNSHMICLVVYRFYVISPHDWLDV